MPDDQAISQTDFKFSAVNPFHMCLQEKARRMAVLLHIVRPLQGYQPPLKLNFLSLTFIYIPYVAHIRYVPYGVLVL